MKRQKQLSKTETLTAFVQAWGFMVMVLSITLGAVGWGVQRLADPQLMPIKMVRVDGEMRYLQRRKLEETVYRAIEGSFFSVDLPKIRAELERLAWVDQARIRRVWPDRLQVHVIEQQPLARWGENSLLNRRGETFRPEVMPDLPNLVRLAGANADARMVSLGYQEMKPLLQTVGLEIASARMDVRQSWLLRTSDGLELNLGRREMMQRLGRFIDVYSSLNQVDARLRQVDLRYTNGFTATWEPAEELQTNKEHAEKLNKTSRFAGI